MGRLIAQPPASKKSVRLRFRSFRKAKIAVGSIIIPRNTAIQINITYPGRAEMEVIVLVMDLKIKLIPAPNAAKLKPPASSIIEPLPISFWVNDELCPAGAAGAWL